MARVDRYFLVTEHQRDADSNSTETTSRRTKEIRPDRGTMTYDYDLANNVISITERRGITATMTVNTPDGITLNYSYDERSYLLSVTDNTVLSENYLQAFLQRSLIVFL